MDQNKERRKREDIMKEDITTDELVIREVLPKLIYITHLLTHQENFMHMRIP
jgi:hypothetical protein